MAKITARNMSVCRKTDYIVYVIHLCVTLSAIEMGPSLKPIYNPTAGIRQSWQGMAWVMGWLMNGIGWDKLEIDEMIEVTQNYIE